MKWLAAASLTVSVLAATPAFALPNGAPWGSANPKVQPNCSSCHFDGEAVTESGAIVLSGLPDHAVGGEVYELTLKFKMPVEGATGFLISANDGAFSAQRPDLEFRGSEIRSISPSAGSDAQWTFTWAAPASWEKPVVFEIGVNAANDDASPFGDEIHFRTYSVDAK